MKGQRAYPYSYLPPDEVVQFFTECLTRLKGKEIFIDDLKRLKHEEIFTDGLKRLKRKEKMATRQRTRLGRINPSLPTEVPPKVEDSPEWGEPTRFRAHLTLMDEMTIRNVRRANAIYLDTRDRLMAAMRETR